MANLHVSVGRPHLNMLTFLDKASALHSGRILLKPGITEQYPYVVL
jgi:hypothetical protein